MQTRLLCKLPIFDNMLELFKRDPLKVLPSFLIDGSNVVFQEVLPLSKGISFQKAFNRSLDFFRDFKAFIKGNCPSVNDIVVDELNHTISFSYWDEIAGVWHMNEHLTSWNAFLRASVVIQFKDERFRYTMRISDIVLRDSNFNKKEFNASTVAEQHKRVFLSNECEYDEEMGLRYAAKRLRSYINQSTVRPDEDW